MHGGGSPQGVPCRSALHAVISEPQASNVEGGGNADEETERPPAADSASFHQCQGGGDPERGVRYLVSLDIFVEELAFSESDVCEYCGGEVASLGCFLCLLACSLK